MALHCTIALPPSFRAGDILAFHRRDPQEVAERVSDEAIEKGLIWHGRPAWLQVIFDEGEARARLVLDGATARAASRQEAELEAMVRRMLGLSQGVEAFEQQHADHPELGRLIALQRGLRVPAAATPFEALTWAVTGQQISVAAAVSLRRRLIQATDVRHVGNGLLCHPDAPRLAALSEADLKQAGFSSAKASTLSVIARMVAEGALPLDEWARALPTDMPVEEMEAKLQAIRGIGPWTINYTLLRGFGWMDGSLHGDVAVRRALQTLLGQADAVSEARTRAWLQAFSPWRALVAAHLWASRSVQA